MVCRFGRLECSGFGGREASRTFGQVGTNASRRRFAHLRVKWFLTQLKPVESGFYFMPQVSMLVPEASELSQQGETGAALLAHSPIGETSWMETKPHHRYILPQVPDSERNRES